MWIGRNTKIVHWLPRKSRHIFLLVIILLIFILFLKWKSGLENSNFCSYIYYYNNMKNSNITLSKQIINSTNLNAKIINGYLVWSSKCHMPSEDYMHPSIMKFVKKIEYEECSTLPLLSYINRETNNNIFLIINKTVAKNYDNFTCCWSPIFRPKITKPLIKNLDSTIIEGNCTDFNEIIQLPLNLEIVMVLCRKNDEKTNIIYKNIHAIMNPNKFLHYQNISQFNNQNKYKNNRKMSILILGLDSISRLNFLRSLPKTEKYLRETGWFNLKGYNKIGLNTFPNLMALLTGHNESTVESICKPNQVYGLDNCSFIWHDYKKAGYITAYGEDYGPYSTFNYDKFGFVNPPTDYYLRAYIIATEKLLKPKYKFVNRYCTGPELAVNRILNYASNFAKEFLNIPYFGFFWANSISHNDLNAISSMDTYFFNYFNDLERHGVFNDTMVIFLSDHGLRFGQFRQTYIGWYEERLPFVYLRIPLHHQLFNDNPNILKYLKVNQHRLSSPFDLYETLRDVLMKYGITVNSSTGCTTCRSIFQPIQYERSCSDAGISPNWCTCVTTQLINEQINNGTIAINGVNIFLKYVNNTIIKYKNKYGKQLCAQLYLKKIHYINQIIETNNDINAVNKKYLFRIEVIPGNALYEFLIYSEKNINFTVKPEEISRINSYANDSKCLDNEFKKFCICL